MASRSFIVVSAALLGGILVAGGAALYLVRPPAPGSDAGPDRARLAAEGPTALGVGGADYDPAGRADQVVQRDAHPLPDALAQAGALERPNRELEPPAPPSETIAADPGLIAASAASAAVQPQVAAEVASLLDRQHDALRAACWPGAQAAAKFPIEASFDAAGKPLSLAIPDHGEMPEVSACLRAQLGLDALALATPPNADVAVTVELTFP